MGLTMGQYLKTLASCKLHETATLKICGKTATLQEIAAALKGDTYGEWINIRGPGHSSDDRSLGIKFDKNARDGFIVHSLSDDDPVECRQYVKAKFAEIGILLPIRHSIAEHEDGPNFDAGKAQRTETALQIWSASVHANGTLAETYLKGRGITGPIPPTIRFHSNLRHPSGVSLPTMVALVTRGTDAKPVGISRTFLAPSGKGKAECVPNKMMLGPCSGGAVRLGEAGNSVMVGEGIETCLSVMQATGRPVWAALSTSSLGSLDLPQHIHEVTVLADGEGAGEKAAKHAASRWVQEGRRVRIARPPKGLDFNDVLLSHTRPEGAP
jgi:putative DNA primase/helicase